MMKSQWLPLLPILPYGELANDQDDKIGLVPPLTYFEMYVYVSAKIEMAQAIVAQFTSQRTAHGFFQHIMG